jgi:hypothetical protein
LLITAWINLSVVVDYFVSPHTFYVEEMVKLRCGAEIRALRDAMEAAATNQVCSKDEQTALLRGELSFHEHKLVC